MGDELYKMLMDARNLLKFDIPTSLNEKGEDSVAIRLALKSAYLSVETVMSFIEAKEDYDRLKGTFENFPG